MQTAVVHAGMSIPKASQPWAICIELATCSFGRGSLGLGACGALAGGYQSMSMLLDCCREGSREPRAGTGGGGGLFCDGINCVLCLIR